MTDPQPRLLSGPQCWQAMRKASLEDIDRAIDDRNERIPLAERYRGLLLIRRALLFVESDLRRYAGVLDRAMRALGGTPSGKLPSGPDGTDRFANTSRFFIAKLPEDQRARVLGTVRTLYEQSEKDRKILAAWARHAGELRMESDA